MPLKRETTRPAFLLNSVDRHGRPIGPAVLSVAQEISQQAVAYAERIIGDPAVVQNLFEEAAAAVSEAAETKHASDKPPIRDLRAYLFRTFARRIAREKRKEAALRNEINLKERNRPTSGTTEFARELLLDEVMAACDKVTQEIALRRLEGFSWDEIGDRYRISAHVARLRFSKALQRARKRLTARSVGG